MKLARIALVLVVLMLTVAACTTAVSTGPAAPVQNAASQTVAPAAPAASAVTADHSSLVSRWEGKWSTSYMGHDLSGPYYLVVNEAEAGKFKGSFFEGVPREFHAGYTDRYLDVAGTIAGPAGAEKVEFKYSTFVAVSLERHGDSMVGTGCARKCSHLELHRVR